MQHIRAGSKGPETRQEVSIKIKQEVQDKEHWEKQKGNSTTQTGRDTWCILICLLKNNYVLLCDNAVVKVWLGLGTETTWLGLEKDHGLH